jgi:hypothetical protein
MRVRAGIVVVLGAAALAGTPGDAHAQAPPSYGGGLLPTAGVPPPGYRPSVGITLQPRGNRIALRFDTTVRCGRTSFDISGRRVAAFDGTHVTARESLVQILDRGRRLLYTWTLSGTVAGPQASGTLRVVGGLRVRGRRTQSCLRAPNRAWQARLIAAPTGAPAPPAAGATLLGGSNQALVDRLPGPVVVRVTGDGRASARWTSAARCGRGPREVFANFTPPRRITPAGTLTSDEHFSLAFTDAVVRYHAQFAAQFTSDGVRGTLRLRANVFDRRGRRLQTRCDSGTRTWTALPAAAPGSSSSPGATGTASAPPAGAAPPAPPLPSPPRRLVPGPWSLTVTGEPTESITSGQTFVLGSAGEAINVLADPTQLIVDITPAGDLPWSFLIGAPPGQALVSGATYSAVRDTRVVPPFASLDVSGRGRGCNMLTGTFTVDALAFDPDGLLRTALVHFEQHCEQPTAPALRGTFEFHAA